MNVSQVLLDWCQQNGHSHQYESETTSTNDLAKQQALKLESPFYLFFSDSQSQGRGRNSNTWTSPQAGSGLLSSWVFTLPAPAQQFTAPLIGLAVFRSLSRVWPQLSWAIKAPNDILLGQEKMGGLLVEAVQKGDSQALIVGLGLNLFAEPEGVAAATHLNGSTGLAGELELLQLNPLFDHLMQNLQHASEWAQAAEISPEHRQELLQALNRNKNLPQPILEVLGNGDLVTQHGRISWMEI